VCDLAKAQAAIGHHVGVVCDADGDSLTETRLEALRPHLALGLFRVGMSRAIAPSDFFAYHAIRAHALGLGVDVIHGHGAKGGAYSRLVGASLKRMGKRLASCYTPHGGSLHYHPKSVQGRVYMGLERHLARSSDGLIFESAFSEARYKAQVGVPGCAMQVIPNGLGDDDFAPVSAQADAADFLFVGELRHLKGVDVLIEALAEIARVRPVRAVIVGAGPDAETFKQQAAAAGLGDAVSFPGAMPAREAFKKGRVLVVPSRAESFPYIVLEAGAAGLPMLATDVGGIPEIVAGTRMALLPPDDVQALTRALRKALDDPAHAQEVAHDLKLAIAAKFTVSSMTSSILQLYYDALGRD
jgi:glycosyltransferase involved in cell wall biosynthesis